MRSRSSGVGLPSLSAGVPSTTMASKLCRLVLARGASVLAAAAQINNPASNPKQTSEIRTANGKRGLRCVRLRELLRGIGYELRFVPANDASSLHSNVTTGGTAMSV